MVEIGTGIFLILVGMGFGSLIISNKFGALFAVIGAVSFFAISLLMFGNYDVVSTTTYNDGTTQWNETNYMVGAEGDTDFEIKQKMWVGWIFLVLGLIAVVVFFVEALKLGKPT